MQKWEYLFRDTEEMTVDAMQIFLNEMGQEGWELVSVDDEFCYFKRPTVVKPQVVKQVTFCNWCKDPNRPDPLFHPNGQCEHLIIGQYNCPDKLDEAVGDLQ